MKLKILVLLLFSALELVKAQKNWTRDVYVPNSCVCGTAGNCEIAATGGISDGDGNISPRIVATGEDNMFTGGVEEICQPISTGIPIVAVNQSNCNRPTGLERCCTSTGYSCGLRYPPIENAPKATLGSGQANYGSHPWHAVINGPNNTFIASGVLIDQLHVLTAAHKLFNINMTTVEVRLGVYNRLNNRSDPLPTLIYNATYVIHPSFTFKNLKNNIAVLTLSRVVPLGQFPTTGNICLPNTTIANLTCYISGFGIPDPRTPILQRTIMETDVTLVDHLTCQNQLRATNQIGKDFILDGRSFVCAGGELKKDACTYDGGAPLACRVFDRFYLVGLVAWGLGCGNASVPGVYVNVRSFIPWIQQVIRAEATAATTTRPRTTVPSTPTLANAAGTTTTTTTRRENSTSTTASAATTARTTVRAAANRASTTKRATSVKRNS